MPDEKRDNESKPGGLISLIGLESLSALAVMRATVTVMIVITAAYVLINLIQALSFLLFLCVLSIFLAYLLEPLVRFVQRPFEERNLEKLMPRPLAILVSYALVFSVLGIVLSYLLPLVAAQISDFVLNFPSYANAVQARIDAINTGYSELMITQDVQAEIKNYITGSVRSLTDIVTSFVGSFVVTTLTYLPWLLLIPILSFFFLKDAVVLRNMFLGCFPSGKMRARADSLLSDVNNTLAAYTRAQLISCLLIGLVSTLAFTLIGLEYALLLGLLAGILEFIPLLGPLTIGIAATSIGALSGDPRQAIWTAGFLILMRLTHDYVTYPRIVRHGVHLHPFAVILSVLAGEQIASLPGVFLAIPIIALVTVFHKHFLQHSGKSGIFAGIFKRRDDRTVEES